MSLFKSSPHLDWLYPPFCILCESSLRRGQNLCLPCRQKLPCLPASSCRQCGQTFDGKIEAPSACPNCLNLKPRFDFATAALKATDDTIKLVHAFKLLKRPELGGDLVEIARSAAVHDPRLSALERPILIPVPLHGKRLRERGFNQAEALAQPLSLALKIDYLVALKRVRPTSRQATLSRRERLQNLRQAFQMRVKPAQLAGRNLILIDDVFTTGSTAQECARVLRSAKPAQIAVFTLVRA